MRSRHIRSVQAMARTLSAAVRQYRQQQRFTSVALAQAERTWENRNYAVLTALMMYLQVQSAQAAIDSVEDMLVEQGVAAPLAALPVASTYAGMTSGGGRLDTMLRGAKTVAQLFETVNTQIADVGRVAQGVSSVARPQLEGFVRYLNPPSCGRCVILAGEFYPYSDGFARHENCDCIMVPAETAADVSDLLTDPMAAFRAGQIKDLTVAETKAIREGADINQVVNIRKKSAGLRVAGRVLERGGRLTPEGIYALASDRSQIIELLITNGYLSA